MISAISNRIKRFLMGIGGVILLFILFWVVIWSISFSLNKKNSKQSTYSRAWDSITLHYQHIRDSLWIDTGNIYIQMDNYKEHDRFMIDSLIDKEYKDKMQIPNTK